MQTFPCENENHWRALKGTAVYVSKTDKSNNVALELRVYAFIVNSTFISNFKYH